MAILKKSKRGKIQGTVLFACLVFTAIGHHFLPSKKTESSLEGRYPKMISKPIISNLENKKEIDLKKLDPAINYMWGIKKMNALKAWDKLKEKGSKAIIVAIIDTGIDTKHPDLKENLWINKGEVGKDKKGRNKSKNGIDDDQNGCVDDVHGCNMITRTGDIKDLHGHGTHIAGIIGASGGNGIGISGVSPNVSLMILKYFSKNASGMDNLLGTIKAIEYAINNGARIINYSGGGLEPSQQEKAAIIKAEKKGILFVAAAGNEKSNSDIKGYYPADYKLSNIISVTAIDNSENILPTSNYGAASVDLAAPGNNILSTIPNGKYGKMTGTSQATAFATGVAALIMSKYPDFNAKRIIKHLTETGDLDNKLIGKTIYKKRLNTYRALTILDKGVGVTGVVPTNTINLSPTAFTVSDDSQKKEDGEALSRKVSSQFKGLNQINKHLNKIKREKQKTKNKKRKTKNNKSKP